MALALTVALFKEPLAGFGLQFLFSVGVLDSSLEERSYKVCPGFALCAQLYRVLC